MRSAALLAALLAAAAAAAAAAGAETVLEAETGQDDNSVVVRATLDAAGTLKLVVLLDSDEEPLADAVLLGTGAIRALEINVDFGGVGVPTHEVIRGLPGNVPLAVYGAVDGGDGSVLAVRGVVATDRSPPRWASGYPRADAAAASSAGGVGVLVRLHERGSVRCAAVEEGHAPLDARAVEEDQGAAAADVNTTAASVRVQIDGLGPDTAYDVYCVASDAEVPPNTAAEPEALLGAVATLVATPGAPRAVEAALSREGGGIEVRVEHAYGGGLPTSRVRVLFGASDSRQPPRRAEFPVFAESIDAARRVAAVTLLLLPPEVLPGVAYSVEAAAAVPSAREGGAEAWGAPAPAAAAVAVPSPVPAADLAVLVTLHLREGGGARLSARFGGALGEEREREQLRRELDQDVHGALAARMADAVEWDADAGTVTLLVLPPGDVDAARDRTSTEMVELLREFCGRPEPRGGVVLREVAAVGVVSVRGRCEDGETFSEPCAGSAGSDDSSGGDPDGGATATGGDSDNRAAVAAGAAVGALATLVAVGACVVVRRRRNPRPSGPRHNRLQGVQLPAAAAAAGATSPAV